MLSTLLLSLLAGCTPQTATFVDGAYVGFFPASTSRTVLEGDIPFDEAAVNFNIDCSSGDDRLENVRQVCNQNWPPKHETWLDSTGFMAMSEAIEPWRGEAVMTSEGDFQITFHHTLPGGEDFRFAFVVDPSFQPTECTQDESGEGTVRQDVDGDWISNWSADLDDSERYEPGTMYYLNAASYQFNPSNTEETWSIPQPWRAGYARGRFGPEDLFMRTARYGEPGAYALFEEDATQDPFPSLGELFYVGMDAGTDPNTVPEFMDKIADVQDIADEIRDDVNHVIGAELDGLGLERPFEVRPLVHSNLWRTADGLPAGLDGWVEMHYNYVRIDPGSELVEGGAASGEFSLVFEANESLATIFVQGSFTTENIKKDRWVTADVSAQQLEQNGTELCGE